MRIKEINKIEKGKQRNVLILAIVLILCSLLFWPKVALAENLVTESTAKSSNANLKNLGINPNDFKGFRANKTSYDITVDDDVTDIEVYATTQDAKAELEGTGEYELSEGLNKILVTVIAEDGTEKVYTLNITKNKVAEVEENTVENQIVENVTNTVNKNPSEIKKDENTANVSSVLDTMEKHMSQTKKTGYIVVGLIGIISLLAIYFAISSYRNGNYEEYEDDFGDDKADDKPEENYYEEYLNSIEEKRKLEAENKEEIGTTVNILEDIYNKSKEEKENDGNKVETKKQEETIAIPEEKTEENKEIETKVEIKDQSIGQEYNFSRRPRGKGKHF